MYGLSAYMHKSIHSFVNPGRFLVPNPITIAYAPPAQLKPNPHTSHPMHTRILGQTPKFLSPEIQRHTHQTPKHRQSHVRHDRLDKARLLNPRDDEDGEAVAPQILVDGNGHKERAGNGLVAVDGVGGGESR